VCDVTLVISSREGIEIDYCPQCRGVWLDRGELDKIIERAEPSAGRERDRDRAYDEPRREERSRRDDDDWDDRRSPRKRKKRSFLEDIFEFD
jgi:Zn-finger nucleic acid-binding protein